MLYRITNISGGQVVCDTAIKGKTLRLNDRQSETIKDTEMTPYIERQVKMGIFLSETVSDETKSTKATVSKNSKKEKEEK